MKITPIKEYKAPKYAARIAAVLALTAVASGCAEIRTSGAAATYETSSSVTENTGTVKLNGNADTTKAAETVTEKETECPDLEGEVAVPVDPDCCKPEVTTVATAAGFAGIKDFFDRIFGGGGETEPEVRLEGDVPMQTDNWETGNDIEGLVPAPTDDGEEEIIELGGDVAVEEDEELPDDLYFAKHCSYELEYAFENLTGSLTLVSYESGESMLESGQYRNHYIYSHEIPGTEKYDELNISFVTTDSDIWKEISGSPDWQKVNGGYVREMSEGGKLLLIGVESYNDIPSERFCEELVSDLLAKGVIN